MTVQMNPQAFAPKFSASLERRVLPGGGNAEAFEDIVLVSGARTPFTKMGGKLEGVTATDLLSTAMKGALAKAGVDAKDVNQAIVGNIIANDEQAAFTPRGVALATGLPEGTIALGANRLCGTGFEVIRQAAHLLTDGGDSLILAGGVENMSRTPVMDNEFLKEAGALGAEAKALGKEAMALAASKNPVDKLKAALLARKAKKLVAQINAPRALKTTNPLEKGLTDPSVDMVMYQTADELAARKNVSRDEVDAFAARSQQLAAEAQAEGRFDDEIVPVKRDALGKRSELPEGVDEVGKDDYMRPGTTTAALGKLKVLDKNREDAKHTAGSSSGIVDGAAAMLVSTGKFAKEKNLDILAKLNSVAVVGCDPKIMGYGPVRAMQEALNSAGLTLDDMDFIEVNEAFSGQTLAVIKGLAEDHAEKTGRDEKAVYNELLERLNVDGGAISMGHPLAASGSRITLHAANRLKQDGKRYALVGACIGGGQGIAMVIENPKATALTDPIVIHQPEESDQ